MVFFPLATHSAFYLMEAIRSSAGVYSYVFRVLSVVFLLLGVCIILGLILLAICGLVRCHPVLDKIPVRLFSGTGALFFSYLAIAAALAIGHNISGRNGSSDVLVGQYVAVTLGYCLSAFAVFKRKQFQDTRYRVAEVAIYAVVTVRTACFGSAVMAAGTYASLSNVVFTGLFVGDALLVTVLLAEPIISAFMPADTNLLYVTLRSTDPFDTDLLQPRRCRGDGS